MSSPSFVTRSFPTSPPCWSILSWTLIRWTLTCINSKGVAPGPTIVVQLCLSTPFREEMATGSNNSSTSVAMGHEVQVPALLYLLPYQAMVFH
ncbi:hypothetical protein ZEAMMB73_Zm00001d000319 [Zea mays]|nr:hypothetical protein ZEAMMB73_Zm00001d000319 [Zea mays]